MGQTDRQTDGRRDRRIAVLLYAPSPIPFGSGTKSATEIQRGLRCCLSPTQ